jgi:hypothetical protein
MTRDQDHKWDGCKCSVCTIARDTGHKWDKWDGCKCSRCGKTRNLFPKILTITVNAPNNSWAFIEGFVPADANLYTADLPENWNAQKNFIRYEQNPPRVTESEMLGIAMKEWRSELDDLKSLDTYYYTIPSGNFYGHVYIIKEKRPARITDPRYPSMAN